MNSDWGDLQRARVLRFIEDFIQENGFSPTVREIGRGVGLKSSSTIYSHLMHLLGEGRITWNETSPRTVRPVVKADA